MGLIKQLQQKNSNAVKHSNDKNSFCGEVAMSVHIKSKKNGIDQQAE
jgi:hypothetical protein